MLFRSCAREMLVTRNYTTVQINFQPFWEKPPLFIWMQALSMKMFGVNEFAARFPNAICGIFTLITVFKIGESVYDKRFGFLWGLSFGGSILPFLYFKSGIIDPWFNLFIFSGICRLVLITNNVTSSLTVRNGIFAGVFFGLATLTKGPVAILIALLSVMAFIILQRKLWIFSLASIAAIASSYIIVAGSWFLFLFIIGKQQLINDFLAYQLRLFSTEDSGHGGFFGYHFVVLLIGCFPASLFSFIAWRRFSSDTPFQRFFKNWMVLLFWVVLILFSIVKTKIVHYSSLCYFPLSFLSAYGINKLLTGESKWNSRLKFLGIVISLFLGLAFSLIPLIDNLKEIFISSSMIKDSFTIACLSERSEEHTSELQSH